MYSNPLFNAGIMNTWESFVCYCISVDFDFTDAAISETWNEFQIALSCDWNLILSD
jgi:hypothetical protein